MKRLAIITTHPIQYNAPLFALLASREKVAAKVFYTWGESVLSDKFDPGFGKVINWDIPLLEGYDFEFCENSSTDKGSHHFNGIDNPGLVSRIDAFKPDAILVYGWSFKSHLKIMRHYHAKLPILFRGDSTLLDESGFFQRIKRSLFLRWVYRHIDMAIYTGKSNYAYYLNAGVNKRKLIFGPHAIDNNRYACKEPACKQASETIRQELKIADADKVILFAGKLETKKNPLLLIEAFRAASFLVPVHLIITGNGELHQQLKIAAAGSDHIHFLDFQNQASMPSVYAAADIFVLPSQGPGETWGLAVNEAMAAGKAVIVSDRCGAAADLVHPCKNGFVFQSGNESQLKTYLEQVINTRGLVTEMGQQSTQIIAAYTFEKLAEAIEEAVSMTTTKRSNNSV